MSSLLAGPMPRPPAPPSGQVPPAGGAPPQPDGGRPAYAANGTLTVIAGIAVLLLAMGVGVLIGRAGAAKQASTPTPVITVAAGGGAASTGSSSEASFGGDWPAGTKGYTVQLQTLPQSGTTVAAVAAAKTAATVVPDWGSVCSCTV